MVKTLVQIILAIILSSAQSFSQDFWQQTNGPTGGYIEALAINSEGNIFVGNSGGGISRSTDNGATWLEIYFSGEFSSVSAIALNSEDDINSLN